MGSLKKVHSQGVQAVRRGGEGGKGIGADGDIKKKQWNRQAEYEWDAHHSVSVGVAGCSSCPRVAGGRRGWDKGSDRTGAHHSYAKAYHWLSVC